MDVPPDRVEQWLAPKPAPTLRDGVTPAVVAGVVPEAAALAVAPAAATPAEARR
jgi:hypothetical protein